MNLDIFIFMFTDSKRIFNLITQRKRPTERHLAIIVAAVHNAYRKFEIERVGPVRGEYNLADSVSKNKHNDKLPKLEQNNKDETTVQK